MILIHISFTKMYSSYSRHMRPDFTVTVSPSLPLKSLSNAILACTNNVQLSPSSIIAGKYPVQPYEGSPARREVHKSS